MRRAVRQSAMRRPFAVAMLGSAVLGSACATVRYGSGPQLRWEGVVQSRSGKPLANADFFVLLHDQSRVATLAMTSTDSVGRYRLMLALPDAMRCTDLSVSFRRLGFVSANSSIGHFSCQTRCWRVDVRLMDQGPVFDGVLPDDEGFTIRPCSE